MTTPDWVLAVVLFFGFYAVARALDTTNKHLSNIADRLLDIDRTLRGRSE